MASPIVMTSLPSSSMRSKTSRSAPSILASCMASSALSSAASRNSSQFILRSPSQSHASKNWAANSSRDTPLSTKPMASTATSAKSGSFSAFTNSA